jgi:hypothetical protein
MIRTMDDLAEIFEELWTSWEEETAQRDEEWVDPKDKVAEGRVRDAENKAAFFKRKYEECIRAKL